MSDNSHRSLFTKGQEFRYGYYQFLDHFLTRNLAFKMTRGSRKRFYSKLHDRFEPMADGQVYEVDRRKDLSLKEFREKYLLPGKPVVFEGAANDWPCVKNWTLEYMKEKHGDDQIVMVDQEQEDNPYEELTLGELIDGIRDGLSRYYRFYPLLQRHPEHLLDFDVKWLRERRHQKVKFDTWQVFIGPHDSYTPLHNANAGNLFTQVYGEKIWMLYPQDYVPIIDPSPVLSNYRTAPIRKDYGPFNPFEPDYEPPYHLYRYMDGFRAHLKPGDVLFNPCYHWHAVKNIGDTIGVGFRWLPLGYTFRNFPLFSLLDMCAMHPPFWKTWKLSQIDPNLTHLAEHGRLKAYLKDQEAKKNG